MKTNYVTLLVDASGSMGSFEGKIPVMVKEITDQLFEDSRRENQKTLVSLVTFAYVPKRVQSFQDYLAPWTYHATGQTALMDSMKFVMEQHMGVKSGVLDDVSHLVTVITDGVENQSNPANIAWVKEHFTKLQNTGKFTFTFNMPPGYADNFCRVYNVPRGNCREWEQTQQGFYETQRITTNAVTNYMKDRSKGLGSTQTFYSTVTDLSNVTKGDLAKCDDLTGRFRVINVPSEQVIKPFVEKETGFPLIKGTVFYQLTKPEEIQAHKDVIIKEKGRSTLYGGSEARKLLGLQPYKNGRVKPGNHANYDIFVQSTSDNRKLVRGTSVLVVR